MKLRIKLFIITLLAMFAFVGVGFAAWTFTKTVDADDVAATGLATAAIEAHDLVVKNADESAVVTQLYIICDAPSGQSGLVAGQGIYWATDAAGANPITQLVLIGSVTEDDNDIADISQYVGTFTGGAITAINGTWVNVAAASALNQDVTSTGKDNAVKYTYTLPALSYADVPESVAEVDALETEVNAISITIEFHFNVKSVVR